MIICSCNVLTDKDILAAVDRLILHDPLRLLTPVGVYKSLDRRPRCGGCLPHANGIVQARVSCLTNVCTRQTCACRAARLEASQQPVAATAATLEEPWNPQPFIQLP